MNVTLHFRSVNLTVTLHQNASDLFPSGIFPSLVGYSYIQNFSWTFQNKTSDVGEGWRMTNIEYLVIFEQWNIIERIVLYVVLAITGVAFVFKNVAMVCLLNFFVKMRLDSRCTKKLKTSILVDLIKIHYNY